MRAVVQRVHYASVSVGAEEIGSCGPGLLVYVGVSKHDTARDASWLAQKVGTLRVFADGHDRMTFGARDVRAEVLVISQFTLYGDMGKGRRPSFAAAAPPDTARTLYELVCENLRSQDLAVQTGRFRADMAVVSSVDGPVTLLLDSDKATR